MMGHFFNLCRSRKGAQQCARHDAFLELLFLGYCEHGAALLCATYNYAITGACEKLTPLSERLPFLWHNVRFFIEM